MNHRVCRLGATALIALAAAFWISGVSTASALLPGETQLTTDPSDQIKPDVSGNTLVFQDERNGDSDVFTRDLVTGVETNLTDYSGDQTDPAIDGGRVVYYDTSDRAASSPSLWCQDIASGEETFVAGDVRPQADISGNRIVYANIAGQLFCYDLATATTVRFAADSLGTYGTPVIDGSRVVYGETRSASTGLTCYDFVTGVTTRLPSIWGDQGSLPSISGDRIVYQTASSRIGTPSYRARIHLYDMATGTSTVVSPYDAYERNIPSIKGDKLVYQDKRDGAWNVYLFDLATGLDSRLTASGPAVSAAITNGSVVLYSDNRDGNYNLFSRALPKPTISASGPAVVAHMGYTSVTGVLTAADGRPLAGREVWLQNGPAFGLIDPWKWNKGSPGLTDSAGRFSVRTPQLVQAHRFRVIVAGDGSYYVACASPTMIVRPRAALGTPRPARKLLRNKTTSVSGALAEYDAEIGDVAGTMECFRYERGKWRLRRTFNLTVRRVRQKGGGTISYYFANTKLPSGKWRLRARHDDVTHSLTYSKWLKATVR